MTFGLRLDQIDAARLEALRADGVREGRQLEYKESLPGNSDDDKKEFLADVASFANAAGGDLIFGIRGRRDADSKPTGEIDAVVGLKDLSFDGETLRLESIIRDGIAPRMPPVVFLDIRQEGKQSCLLVRVPRSWAALHMVTYKNWSRFYSRTSAGKYQLDVQEIRAAFLAAETAYDSLRRIRTERVAQVLALETPIQMAEGPKFMLHALACQHRRGGLGRFLRMTEIERVNALPMLAESAANWRFNLDGFVLHTLRKDLDDQFYTQVFRSGGIEAISGALPVKDERRGGFWAWGMEGRVIAVLGRFQQFWQSMGVTPPLVVGLTLAGVKGWKVLRGAYDGWDPEAKFDRDVVNPQEVVLSDLAVPADVVLSPCSTSCGVEAPGPARRTTATADGPSQLGKVSDNDLVVPTGGRSSGRARRGKVSARAGSAGRVVTIPLDTLGPILGLAELIRQK